MILRCLTRPVGGVQAAWAGAARRQVPASARRSYTVPTLLNEADLQQQGVSGLFTPKGFQVGWTEYQQHMVDELNASTSGTPFENQDPKSLVIEFARDPTRAYLFNVASMAFNNHFFFRGINSDPNVQSRPSTDLTNQIRNDFSSLDTLKETFIDTADAMFGPGFVWLVQTNDSSIGRLRVLPTYLAGSPLSAAHYRRQSQDLNTHNADSYQALNSVGAFGSAAKQNKAPKKPLGGVDVVPLMCVNTWEHVWLHDYGVKGKRQFLEAWWDKIDWELVRQNTTLTPTSTRSAQKFVYPGAA